jgi:aspartate/glutamate racemase
MTEIQKNEGQIPHLSQTEYFRMLILKHNDLHAVILECTEYPLVVDETNSVLPIIDRLHPDQTSLNRYRRKMLLGPTKAYRLARLKNCM